MPSRKNLSFSQQIAIDRRGNPYVWGGTWDPYKRAAGCDCSGCVIDILDAAVNGTQMSWSRLGLSTESWRPPSMGGSADPNNGPFGTRMVDTPDQFPPDAAVLVALHHGPGGGASSHMWCQVGDLGVETNGSDGTILNNGRNFSDLVLDVRDSSYGNSWWYLPGPILEDGTPIPIRPSPLPDEAPDTLFPDVSEFQVPVDDSFLQATYSEIGQDWPYRWISIRSNDGTHVDNNFAANYAWCTAAADAGHLDGFVVYYYWRPGSAAVTNHMRLVGSPHPRMVSMIDVESGGNPNSDVSTQLNGDFATLTNWLGAASRVIGYANTADFATMWPTRPAGLRVIGAGYGSNPFLDGQIAHQYTNGQGYGGGLPEGVAPFGACDMNSADGLTPTQLAAALGVGDTTPAPPPPPVYVYPPTDQMIKEIWDQLRGVEGKGWPQLGGRTPVDAIAELLNRTPARTASRRRK